MHSPDQLPISPNPPDPPNPQPKRLLLRILPTRRINPKCDELLLFTIADVTGYKEALATMIDLDPDFTSNNDDVPFESVSTITTPASISVEYTEFTDVFENKEIPSLLPHRPSVDHEISLAPGFLWPHLQPL